MKTLICLLLAAAAPAAAENVTAYHNGIRRHGAYVVPTLTLQAAATMHVDTAFKGAVTGNVYAQPLFWRASGVKPGEVIVATESNVVEALNSATGAVLWSTTLGTPVPLSALPCGNIDPEGITGTPVIDAATGTLYVDALVDTTANGPRHDVFALDVVTGKILPHYPVDLQAALAAKGFTLNSMTQGERSALLFMGGSVYITFAGRSGDCGAYHGAVAQVVGADGSIGGFWATRAQAGGIWSQGGADTDGKSIFVTTGNTMGATSWSDGEAIIRLLPGLAHSTSTKDFFTPANWNTLDADDADLGGTEAMVLNVPIPGSKPAERVLALGKDGHAYLTDAAALGGIGGQLADVLVSNTRIITAAALYAKGSAVSVAFRNGNGITCSGSSISMLHVTATSVSEAWCAPLNGGGAPIVTTTDGSSNGIVWAVGANGDGLLHGFNAETGAVVFNGAGSANAMTGTRNFATPLVAQGHFYVAGQGKIYAFTTTP
jgi:hypothetical protein